MHINVNDLTGWLIASCRVVQRATHARMHARTHTSYMHAFRNAYGLWTDGLCLCGAHRCAYECRDFQRVHILNHSRKRRGDVDPTHGNCIWRV